ncbi:Predicted oxidoreductase [Flagellimonas taeanensis]|uniref:Predicted oxidoreductase n=1 Tax=Flagellimonas taeanensis TaxID=1005926 RepID=A0A1M6WXB6_9FLAO|nr:aldo/keto reductase [Allomuricauda taeanensis]SFB99707.1 Predicted oxidoreductase [Allomuricauda taeanensis]SHK98185.1 Predicted oxidoreductase [Allomuricauda taeanensis]
MIYRNLGSTDEKLSALGLGCMGMSFAYGPANDDESVKVLHRALDLGINFWDTADMYGNGANELLLSRVLKEHRNKVFLATKFGFRFRSNKASDSNSPNTYFDGSPEYVKQAVEASLRRLDVDVIDLYYAHRVDPQVPIEETVGAMADLVKQGKVRYLGLSEASPESIRRANAVHPIMALQSEYSLLTRGVEGKILDTIREFKMSLVPYSPLARGLVTDTFKVDTLDENDFRRTLPRYQGENLDNNLHLKSELQELASHKGITMAQLALAWVLNQGDDILPIPGTRKIHRLEENVKAVDVVLSQEELHSITVILEKYPNVGERYNEGAMRLVNN